MEAWEKALTQLGINLKAPLMAFNNAEKIEISKINAVKRKKCRKKNCFYTEITLEK